MVRKSLQDYGEAWVFDLRHVEAGFCDLMLADEMS